MIKRIIFRTDDVTPCLASVASVVNQRNTMPILATVALYTKKEVSADGRLYMVLIASDGDLWVRREVVIDAESDREVSLCLDAKDFLQYLQGLPNTVLTVEVDDAKQIATCLYTNGHFSLPFHKADAYPRPSTLSGESFSYKLNADALYAAMEKVSFAIANDNVFVIINGIHLEFGENKIIAVATDKRMFAKYEQRVNGNDGTRHCVNLPHKACKILSAALREGESENVEVSFDDKSAIFSVGVFRLTARLLEGRYLEYDNIIPKGYSTTIKIDKSSLISAIKRVSLMGNASDLVAVSFDNGTCTVVSEDLDNSKAATECVNCEYSGELFKIGLSSTYVTSVLKAIYSDGVKIMVDMPVKPAFFYETDGSEEFDYVSMLMPMKFL